MKLVLEIFNMKNCSFLCPYFTKCAVSKCVGVQLLIFIYFSQMSSLHVALFNFQSCFSPGGISE